MQIHSYKFLSILQTKFIVITMTLTIVLFGVTLVNQSAAADSFDCFDAKMCNNALSNSLTCKINTDYVVSVTDKASAITVLSFHGGKIELNTSKISESLATQYGWNRYDLNANATQTCLDGLNNFERLHITATKFDDPKAIALVSSHPKSVAIHGYSSNNGYPDGTICVGGLNQDQITRFINSLNAANYSGYVLTPVNAPALVDDQAACSDLKGTDPNNIVNKNSSQKGLQLELSPKLRADLASNDPQFDSLRKAFYGAIYTAMVKPVSCTTAACKTFTSTPP